MKNALDSGISLVRTFSERKISVIKHWYIWFGLYLCNNESTVDMLKAWKTIVPSAELHIGFLQGQPPLQNILSIMLLRKGQGLSMLSLLDVAPT